MPDQLPRGEEIALEPDDDQHTSNAHLLIGRENFAAGAASARDGRPFDSAESLMWRKGHRSVTGEGE